ncbi:MAG: formylmethanofuran dehydrogenase subunit E family protein [Candidatus Omnitrophica bacterium]|nr:formylmethanofuran dehydrogenase subunit E family protein [Candidatus Omnitrophota bacterium]
MKTKRVSLKQAVDFHGHLGPYLVLGILAGEFAINKLKCKKYFGLEVKVYGANHKPKSCLIDGLQLSSGATYGKGNIQKIDGHLIEIEFLNIENQKKIFLKLKNELLKELARLDNHSAGEVFAKKIYRMPFEELFHLQTAF